MTNTTAPSQLSCAWSEWQLHILGSKAVWLDWQRALKPFGTFVQPDANEQTAWLKGRGLALQMQCLEGQEALGATDAQEPVWGLHSLTLHAPASGVSPWLHEWPWGMDAQALGKAAVLQALQAGGGDVVMSTPSATLLEIGGGEQALGVQCAWQGQQLASLTLVRLGEYAPLQAFEWRASPPQPQPKPAPQPAPVQAPQPAGQATPLITCRSGEPTPKTGVYEAHVPLSHPRAANFNHMRERFWFSRQGQPMIRLGVPDGESLVVWTWRSER